MDQVSTDKRLFIASSELFSNFQIDISLFDVSTLDDIILIFKNNR